MINKDRLKNICADIGVDLDAQALERFELFASMLVEKNKVLNLTAITDPEGIAVKHFADSLTALRMIDLQPGTKVIDVGTGGGFPGIPLLIARPEIKLTMLDSTGKKLTFVSQSVEELGLSANIVHARAEEAGQGELRESFDFAVSRAVAAMNVLCEYCLPFVKVGGTFCAMKGAKGAEELDCAGKAIATLGGKTVLLKLICGFMKPDSGMVTVNGKVIGKDADFPENTGIIIEAPGFLPNYSGMRNLEYLASIRGKIGKEQIESAMKTVGLDPSSKLRVGKYSLGMKQRLGIAQAIMENQQLLILDEPMNALDKDAVEEMRRLFLSFKASGKTMLIVSHNEGDISTLCDEVYEFDGARIKRRENV